MNIVADGHPTKKEMSETEKRKFAEKVARVWASTASVSWSEFTQNTTFHGVKYIFDQKAYKTRRVCWTVFVITSILFFIVQVALRLATYYEYNTNIDVEKIYTTKVVFPAVTICNQNNFRLTATSDYKMYKFIDSVFGSDPNGSDYALMNARDYTIDTTDFWINTAHQLDDLIDSCTWKGQTCNMTTDWVTTLTDMGVCYTFNSDAEQPQEVVEPGAGLGLSLILNVEQYEYMNGPQNDAGIKILLHDPLEFSMLKDLGFAAAPGAHTLVGINSFVISSLGPPFGVCDPLMKNHMSDCRLACRTEHVVEECGCRDVYMPNITGAPVCDMAMSFGCVRKEIHAMQTHESNCTCNIPCARAIYGPSLSNAQLSLFGIERLVLRDPDKRDKVRRQFRDAREVFQRKDSDTATADQESLENIQTLVTRLNQLVVEHLTSLNTGQESELITVMTSAVKQDKQFTNILIGKLEDTIESLDDDFSYIRKTFEKAYNFISEMESLIDRPRALAEHLADCESYMDERGSGEGPAPPPPPPGPVPIVDTSACVTMPDHITHLFDLKNLYMSVFESIFNNTDVSPKAAHYDCLSEMELYLDQMQINETFRVADLLGDILEDPNNSEISGKCEAVVLAAESAGFENLTVWNEEIHEICIEWFDCQTYNDQTYNDLYSLLIKLENAFNLLGNLEGHYKEYVKGVVDIKSLLGDNINQTIIAGEDYLNNVILKTDLSKVFSSHKVTKGIEDLRSITPDLADVIRAYTATLRGIENDIIGAFEIGFRQCIPLLNDDVIANMTFTEVLLNLNVKKIRTLYETITQNREGNFLDMIREGFSLMGTLMEDTSSKLSTLVDKTTDAIESYRSELMDYSATTKMDDSFFMQNFLQVDFFYRELNYEKVVQRPAFELLSLLGEIGGFLGLLLGASVLTVCEMMDYAIISALNRMKKKQNVTPVRPVVN